MRTLSTDANGVPTAGRPELDTDSDGGGLLDSMEDLNLNGVYDPLSESDPYEPGDDRKEDHRGAVAGILTGNTCSFMFILAAPSPQHRRTRS